MRIPPVVRNKAIAVGATDWLESLPDVVRDIEEDWEIQVGATFADATEAFVAAATLEDGGAAVLKVIIPRGGDAYRHEATVLRLANGDGCARLLRADDARGALLLERLGPSLHDLRVALPDRLEILCSVAERIWRPAADAHLPTGATKARWLAESITARWESLDRPCSSRAVDHALSCAQRRLIAHDDDRAVLVHGDVHQWNALLDGDGFKAVDPDGLLAEPEYDLGILMREDPVELLHGDPWDRARWLARRCQADPVAIWEWGAVERVSTGLICTEVGLQPSGQQMLTAAEVCATAH